MVRTHPSTPQERAQWTASMLAHRGDYGLITQLSRASGVSRPTLYAWRKVAEQALEAAFTPPAPTVAITPSVERQVLTLWIAHSSERDIQQCFQALTAQGISLTTIVAILAEAEQRALHWLATHAPSSARALALDEIYANDRRGAYLNVVDVHSGAVWASVGPVAVDTESWTLVLWEVQARGLLWDRLTMDGGAAARAACRSVCPLIPLQGDQWHILHSCAQFQARLDRHVRDLRHRSTVVARQAARLAAGQRPKGRNPQTDIAAHAAIVARSHRVAEAVRYLRQELRRLLDVVVVEQRGLLSGAQRQADLDCLLALVGEVATEAQAPQQAIVRQMHALLMETLSELLTFVPHLDAVQQALAVVLGADEQALLGWAWLRRRALRWSRQDLLAAIPEEWRGAARILLAAWDDAVRVSSAVERYHSILRPHMAVHRRLSSGMLALLAVWHNHRVFRRGDHKGKSPLHLSGMTDAPTDWLVALGYPPVVEALAPANVATTVALAA
jgi:transposase-like protein